MGKVSAALTALAWTWVAVVGVAVAWAVALTVPDSTEAWLVSTAAAGVLLGVAIVMSIRAWRHP